MTPFPAGIHELKVKPEDTSFLLDIGNDWEPTDLHSFTLLSLLSFLAQVFDIRLCEWCPSLISILEWTPSWFWLHLGRWAVYHEPSRLIASFLSDIMDRRDGINLPLLHCWDLSHRNLGGANTGTWSPSLLPRPGCLLSTKSCTDPWWQGFITIYAQLQPSTT